MTFQRQSFEMPGPNHPVTQHHFPGVTNPKDTAVRTSNITLPAGISAVKKKGGWLICHTWLQKVIYAMSCGHRSGQSIFWDFR